MRNSEKWGTSSGKKLNFLIQFLYSRVPFKLWGVGRIEMKSFNCKDTQKRVSKFCGQQFNNCRHSRRLNVMRISFSMFNFYSHPSFGTSNVAVQVVHRSVQSTKISIFIQFSSTKITSKECPQKNVLQFFNQLNFRSKSLFLWVSFHLKILSTVDNKILTVERLSILIFDSNLKHIFWNERIDTNKGWKCSFNWLFHWFSCPKISILFFVHFVQCPFPWPFEAVQWSLVTHGWWLSSCLHRWGWIEVHPSITDHRKNEEK